MIFNSTLSAATAYQDIGTSNNTVSVTFKYQGAEGNGGVAVGLRWNDSAQAGELAYINTTSTPRVALWELSGSWGLVSSTNSVTLSLTVGNTYTLTITDSSTAITASITDDVATRTYSLTTHASHVQYAGHVRLGRLGGQPLLRRNDIGSVNLIPAKPKFTSGKKRGVRLAAFHFC